MQHYRPVRTTSRFGVIPVIRVDPRPILQVLGLRFRERGGPFHTVVATIAVVAKLPHAVAHRPEFQVVALPCLQHHILRKRHVVPCKRTENVGQLVGGEIRIWPDANTRSPCLILHPSAPLVDAADATEKPLTRFCVLGVKCSRTGLFWLAA